MSVYNNPTKPLFVLNIKKVFRYGGRLSRSCHAQRDTVVFESSNTDYVPNGYRLLEEVSEPNSILVAELLVKRQHAIFFQTK